MFTISQILILHNQTFAFNTNILETNVINQILLLIFLSILWKTFNINELIASSQNDKILLVGDSQKRL